MRDQISLYYSCVSNLDMNESFVLNSQSRPIILQPLRQRIKQMESLQVVCVTYVVQWNSPLLTVKASPLDHMLEAHCLINGSAALCGGRVKGVVSRLC